MKPFDPRLAKYAKGAAGYLAASAVVSAVQGLAIVAFAVFAGRAVAAVVMGAEMSEVYRDALLAVAAVAVRGITVWIDRTLAARAAAGARSALRASALESIGRGRPISSSNDTATALGTGLDALDGYFGEFLPQLVRTFVVTPIVVLALLTQDFFTGIAVMLCLPLIPLFMVLIGMATERVQQRQWEQSKRLAGSFLEILEGTSTLKIFGRDRRATQRIRETSDEHRRKTNSVLRVSFVSSMVLELAASLSIALVAVSIGVRLIDGEIALAIAFGLLILTPDAFLPIRLVGAAFHASTEGVVAVQDVLDVIETDAPPASLPDKGAGERGRFVVESLRADESLPPLAIDAPCGTVIAIAGPSGIGKTRAVRALAGLTAGTGSASLDGRVLTREQIAYAQQGSWDAVITGTVRDNLAMGANVRDEEMRRVLDALDVRVSLDARLEPARGGRLGVSGGQVQRIALARAILRSESGAGLLIADEPSSALDACSEQLVAGELRRIANSGVTVVVVTHREALLNVADTVVRLQVMA